jgi:putative sterol carrier protein
MPVFESTDQLYEVMGALFDKIKESPEIANGLLEGKMVVRFHWKDPDGEATIDLRQAPVSFTMGPSDLEPDVEMIQSADVAHRFWLGKLNVPQAIATRKVVSKGSVLKALKLLSAPAQRVAAKDLPIAYARGLERATVPDVDAISEAVRRVVG